MKRFKNILLVSKADSPDKPTLKRAIDLAQQNDAKLKIVDVVPPIKEKSYAWVINLKPSELEKIQAEDKRTKLKNVLSAVNKKNIDIDLKILFGKRFVEIIKEVIRKEHDLVIITAEGRKKFKDQIFGSTALHILRKCPCPVWAMKPSQRQSYKRVIAAVNTDPSEPDPGRLNHVIMDLATNLAKIEDAELSVVHAWSAAAEKILTGRADMPRDKVVEYINEIRSLHLTELDKLLSNYEFKHKLHFLKGDAGDVISEVADKEKADLIVMGTLSRSGIAGFLIGNTAEKILQRVDCSILAVKPEGFETPIKL